jgi:hypothetical protein
MVGKVLSNLGDIGWVGNVDSDYFRAGLIDRNENFSTVAVHVESENSRACSVRFETRVIEEIDLRVSDLNNSDERRKPNYRMHFPKEYKEKSLIMVLLMTDFL